MDTQTPPPQTPVQPPVQPGNFAPKKSNLKMKIIIVAVVIVLVVVGLMIFSNSELNQGAMVGKWGR